MSIKTDKEKELFRQVYNTIKHIDCDDICLIRSTRDPVLTDMLCVRVDMINGEHHRIMIHDKNIDSNEYKDQFLLHEIQRVFDEKINNIRTNSVMLICRFKRLIRDSENIINNVYDELYSSYPKDTISFSIIRETVNKAVAPYYFGDRLIL